MIALAHASEPHLLKFPSPLERDGTLDPTQKISLRTYYEQVLLDEIRDLQSPNSLKEDRTALNHWERLTGDPDIRDATRDHLVALRDGLQCADATKDKIWRELKAIFEAAREDNLIQQVPRIARRMRCRLVYKARKQPQREIVTEDELTALWDACSAATYPQHAQFPPPLLWRVAIVLFWTYGARTLDFLRHLRWSDVRFGDRMLQFTARKTSKLQGLPLTDTVIEHLQTIRGLSDRVFPKFNSPGCFLSATQTWKRGYYATWRGEINATAALEKPVQIKHFRQRVVTRYNAIHPGLGSWIAGHYMAGVSAQSYDLPTDQIRDLLCSAPVPECFKQVGRVS